MNEGLGSKPSARFPLCMDPSVQHGQTRQIVCLMCHTLLRWSAVASAPLLGIQPPFCHNLVLHVAPEICGQVVWLGLEASPVQAGSSAFMPRPLRTD